MRLGLQPFYVMFTLSEHVKISKASKKSEIILNGWVDGQLRGKMDGQMDESK